MPEQHAENQEGYPRENQVKGRGTQPGLKKFPLFPEKISDQDVTGGVARRTREVVKKKDAPWHFRHARQQIGRDGRKQDDEPRDKNSLGAVAFEKMLDPLYPFGRETEPVFFFKAAMAQSPSQPKSP